ncbi:hypothetical protein FZEAL_9327 [Fusarium zealandicum]|uniref:6-phosphogluconolactonase n=1 Tax=Fusarium zealandicum TaxID=1053134 RepID=A0A8H4UC55_9HYPO|nr:hypothetical protein FZEAL_9327 [Fusarium zealandicum]
MKFTSFGLTAALAASVSGLPYVSPRDVYAAATPAARVLLGNSGQIYIADFSPATGDLKISLKEEIVGGNTWMAFAPPNLVYAVDENAAALRLFELDLKNNKLNLKTEKNASTGVVHLEFNTDKTRLVGAAYGNGTVDVWNIEDGGLELIKTIKSDAKLGPNEERQSASHPHESVLDPSGRFFAVNDLGTDSVIIIDSKDDAYEVANTLRVTAGCGPRHGVFYPHGADKATHYIVGCELTNEVLVYTVTYKDDQLAFKNIQTISSYGKDAPAKTPEEAALGEVILAPNNVDLYISNRLSGNDTDSIAHFTIADCGKLTYADTVSTGGILPRMMSFSSTAKHVFVGNQDGDLGLVALKRGTDGKLMEKPVASIKASEFGEAGFGPAFVQQIDV